MKVLNHNDRIKIDAVARISKRQYVAHGTVSTLKGYCNEDNTDYDVALARAIEHGHEQLWTLLDATVLSSDKGYYARRDAERLNDIEVKDGDMVSIDGISYKIKYMGDYSDFIHFIKN